MHLAPVTVLCVKYGAVYEVWSLVKCVNERDLLDVHFFDQINIL
jgi:hypothetical protein